MSRPPRSAASEAENAGLTFPNPMENPMPDASDLLQQKFELWFNEVESILGIEPDEAKAFDLFWSRMSADDAAEVLKYPD